MDPVNVRMSRARLYVLIDGLEQDMRAIVQRELLVDPEDVSILTEREIEVANRRRDLDENGEEVSILHYLDMQTCFDVLLRNKKALPADLVSELDVNRTAFPKLVPVRHRVMHGRPLAPDDPSLAISLLQEFSTSHWTFTRETIGRLRADPTWEPYFDKRPVPFERTLHNLPEVDYDETTFIGRKEEKAKLIDLLLRRRHSVVTVTGEGGIGKTALALDVAYRLLDHEENPYEAILWVSLKTEKLTAFGVEELKGAIRGIENTVVALGHGLVTDFQGSLEDLSAALEGIETLVIIDNLESAQGKEIVEMYDALPTSVNYLFTSRWGVGQLERIFPLPPLSEVESILLLRKFASSRGQRKLASLKDAHIVNVVRELRNSPLAIRWFVLASESGQVPLDALRNQGSLLEFCVGNVVDNLSEDSKAVLTVLRALDRAIGFDEFAILTDMSIDELRKVTQQLTRGSLVVVESEIAGAIAGRLALTPTARSFLPRPDHEGSFIARVLQRERQFKASLEAGRVLGKKRMRQEVVRPRDSNDHAAMYLLGTALSFASSKQFAKAYATIERAKSFNPEYHEVYRISGLVHADENHNETAVSELKVALKYAEDDESLAHISYALADLISKRLHDANLALPHAQVAYDLFPCGDTAFQLGRLLVWTEQFKEGQELIQEALELAQGRHRVILSTVLVDSWGRWAEAEFKGRDFEGALQKASAGFHTGKGLLEQHASDAKLVDALAECVIYFLRSFFRLGQAHEESAEPILRGAARFTATYHRRVSRKKLGYVRDALVQVAGMTGLKPAVSIALNDACRDIEPA